MKTNRIAARFARLADEGRAGLVAYVMAGDPDFETALELVKALPGAGADFIELGFPFTDPMADGPTIQAAALRALKAGGGLRQTLDIARAFRERDEDTPIILMGYFNPIHAWGVADFVSAAKEAGVDGLIVVDVPPEEALALAPCAEAGLDVIRLATPTTGPVRAKTVAAGASGFIYYVSVAGVTGGKSAAAADLERAVARLRGATDLPIAVGFGVKTPEQAAATARAADAVVVGSAIVERIARGLDAEGRAGAQCVSEAVEFVAALSQSVRAARLG
ncbi:MAG: tryptophan synthase subunit alpha [Parvularculaceae bacterium]